MKFSIPVPVQYDTPFSPFSAAEWLHGLDWARENTFDGVELCISHYRGLDLIGLSHELEKRNLGCSTLSTGQSRGLEGLSLTADPDTVNRTVTRFQEHIDAASVLGSRVTVGLLRGAGSSADPAVRERELLMLREALLPIIEYADRKNVGLLLEPLNRYESLLLNSTAETAHYIRKELGAPSVLGILWDLFHANIEDPVFPTDDFPLIHHIHLADSDRSMPGHARLDVLSILVRAHRAGFCDYASFECFNKPLPDSVLREAGDFIRQTRTLLT